MGVDSFVDLNIKFRCVSIEQTANDFSFELFDAILTEWMWISPKNIAYKMYQYVHTC